MPYIVHGLTAVLVILKVLHLIDCSWWIVVAPTLGFIGLNVVLFFVAFIIAALAEIAKIKARTKR